MIAWFAVAVLLTTSHSGAPLSAVIALGVAFYTLGAHTSGRRCVAGAVGGLAAIILIDVGSGGVFQAVGGARPGVWVLLTVAWQAGRELQRRRIEMATLRARTVDLERDREEKLRAAASEERARIARELHDVVAHSVSVMVVQAQAVQRVLEGDEPAARGLLDWIETTGRQALTELRRLLGLLRQFDGHPTLAPQPSLTYLDELVAQVREAGLPVELVVEGPPATLPQGIDLSAYRIVQEGLTNALKHAGPAHARVLVRYTPGELELEVSDDGAAAAMADRTTPGRGWWACASGCLSTVESFTLMRAATAATSSTHASRWDPGRDHPAALGRRPGVGTHRVSANPQRRT